LGEFPKGTPQQENRKKGGSKSTPRGETVPIRRNLLPRKKLDFFSEEVEARILEIITKKGEERA